MRMGPLMGTSGSMALPRWVMTTEGPPPRRISARATRRTAGMSGRHCAASVRSRRAASDGQIDLPGALAANSSKMALSTSASPTLPSASNVPFRTPPPRTLTLSSPMAPHSASAPAHKHTHSSNVASSPLPPSGTGSFITVFDPTRRKPNSRVVPSKENSQSPCRGPPMAFRQQGL